ncbi:MAG: hypothetical protein ACLSAO_05740 [Anaerovoracaceae bacterium]
MNYEVAMEMQRICTGESRELSRGQIAEEILDIKSITKDFNQEKTDKCTGFYNELIRDDTKKSYDVDSLMEETESIKKQMDDFISANIDSDIFRKIYDDIGEFFMNPPFEGLDNIEYGVNEVCVFSIMEYFLWKTSEKYDHERVRREYKESIAKRTYDEVAEHWIGVYDDLQERYDNIGVEFDGEFALHEKLAGCCIVAIAAIRDQDKFALDMAQAGAEAKGSQIIKDYLEDKYEEGESSFTDNVINLFDFVYGNLKN